MTPNTLHRFRPLINFSTDCHFIYIIARVDEHRKQLHSYYKLTEEDIKEITKEWSADLLILANPMELSDVYNTKAMQDTPRPSKTKNPEEIHDIDSASVRTASITPEKGDDGEEIEGTEIKQHKGEVPLPRDEEDSSNKRKVSPLKSSSRKKPRTPITKMWTILTLDDFNFIIAALNDAS
jgi:hypothetical protein